MMLIELDVLDCMSCITATAQTNVPCLFYVVYEAE